MRVGGTAFKMSSAFPEGQTQEQSSPGAFVAPGSGTSTAAIRLDPQGKISDATVSAAAMLGFEPQELCGRTLKELAIEGWQAAADVASARVRFGATESFELALKGRSGRRTLVEMTARAGNNGKAGTLIAWSERRLRRSAASQEADPEAGRIAYRLMHRQEAERLQVARELHDEVAPVVVMVKYMVEEALARLGSGADPRCVETLQDATARLRDVVSELRRIATDLRPKLLDDLGLLATLQWYCRSVEEAAPGVQVAGQFQVSEADVPQRLKLDIFRIVQEALRNAIEHSQAHRIDVSLYLAMDELCVTIEDDGRGFDTRAAAAPDEASMAGLGLQAMRRRVEGTGGRLALEAAPGRGTRICAAWRAAVAPR